MLRYVGNTESFKNLFKNINVSNCISHDFL